MSLKAERVSKWRIKGSPDIGDALSVQGRDYKLLEIKAPILTWRGECTVCARAFEFTTYGKQFVPVATCEMHRGKHR